MKFLDECVTATRVTNKKNIVQTYDVVKSNNDNTVSIFMEYIDGISLREYIETHGYLSLNDALFYFQKILEGVKELHSFNDKIIHRDLKPENILLSKDLRNLKIIDFGISSVFTMVNKDNKLMFTNENVIYGTYPYICPDLLKLRGTNDDAKRASIISEQFDFYSLGVILYEMLAAEKPFYAKNYDKLEVIELPLKYDLMVLSDINPHIPVAIENIIFRCMASKPEDIKYRYENINQIITDLNRYLNQPEKTVADHLLKPRNKRLFQIKGGFNIQGQKLREKFYEKT
jgi:serine/threonine-protein kinase